MAKRFTDTEKWKNPWFRDLPGPYKLLWIYILDNCDMAGIWRLDFGLASYCIGAKVDLDSSETHFDGKILRIDHDKWLVKSFIAFQYGELRDDCRPHQAVLRILSKLGIDRSKLNSIDTLSIDLPKSIHTLKDKDKDKDKDSLSEKFKLTNSDLEEVYHTYPRKEGKSEGLKKAKAEIKIKDDLLDLFTAIINYRAFLDKNKTPPQFIKHFSTFMTSWRDWLDPDHGSTEKFSAAPIVGGQKIVGKIRGAVSKYGYTNGADARIELGEEIWTFILANGGWASMCRMPDNDFAWAKLGKSS